MQDDKDDGGPAFGTNGMGMSLRDYFAAQALAGMAEGRDWSTCPGDDMNALARQAYVIADAMLKARRNAR